MSLYASAAEQHSGQPASGAWGCQSSNLQGYPPRLLAVSECCPAAMLQRDHWSLSELSLIQQVGAGAASCVYYALCRRTHLPLAVKIYEKAKLSRLNRHQVEREVNIHSSLSHPHILDFYAAFEDDQRLYLLLEFAAGGDLFDEVKRRGGRLSEREVVAGVLAPYLEALMYLHARGVVHRDIKPENTVFTKEGILKVADFGLAINQTMERPVTRLGTLDYIAPEVLRCPDKQLPSDNKHRPDLAYGPAVDVWALGVLAYELLVGRPPFGMSCRDDTMRAICAASPPIPEWLSPAAASFITSALNATPHLRPSVAALRQHPWITTCVGCGQPAPAPPALLSHHPVMPLSARSVSSQHQHPFMLAPGMQGAAAAAHIGQHHALSAQQQRPQPAWPVSGLDANSISLAAGYWPSSSTVPDSQAHQALPLHLPPAQQAVLYRSPSAALPLATHGSSGSGWQYVAPMQASAATAVVGAGTGLVALPHSSSTAAVLMQASPSPAVMHVAPGLAQLQQGLGLDMFLDSQPAAYGAAAGQWLSQGRGIQDAQLVSGSNGPLLVSSSSSGTHLCLQAGLQGALQHVSGSAGAAQMVNQHRPTSSSTPRGGGGGGQVPVDRPSQNGAQHRVGVYPAAAHSSAGNMAGQGAGMPGPGLLQPHTVGAPYDAATAIVGGRRTQGGSMPGVPNAAIDGAYMLGMLQAQSTLPQGHVPTTGAAQQVHARGADAGTWQSKRMQQLQRSQSLRLASLMQYGSPQGAAAAVPMLQGSPLQEAVPAHALPAVPSAPLGGEQGGQGLAWGLPVQPRALFSTPPVHLHMSPSAGHTTSHLVQLQLQPHTSSHHHAHHHHAHHAFPRTAAMGYWRTDGMGWDGPDPLAALTSHASTAAATLTGAAGLPSQQAAGPSQAELLAGHQAAAAVQQAMQARGEAHLGGDGGALAGQSYGQGPPDLACARNSGPWNQTIVSMHSTPPPVPRSRSHLRTPGRPSSRSPAGSAAYSPGGMAISPEQPQQPPQQQQQQVARALQLQTLDAPQQQQQSARMEVDLQGLLCTSPLQQSSGQLQHLGAPSLYMLSTPATPTAYAAEPGSQRGAAVAATAANPALACGMVLSSNSQDVSALLAACAPALTEGQLGAAAAAASAAAMALSPTVLLSSVASAGQLQQLVSAAGDSSHTSSLVLCQASASAGATSLRPPPLCLLPGHTLATSLPGGVGGVQGLCREVGSNGSMSPHPPPTFVVSGPAGSADVLVLDTSPPAAQVSAAQQVLPPSTKLPPAGGSALQELPSEAHAPAAAAAAAPAPGSTPLAPASLTAGCTAVGAELAAGIARPPSARSCGSAKRRNPGGTSSTCAAPELPPQPMAPGLMLLGVALEQLATTRLLSGTSLPGSDGTPGSLGSVDAGSLSSLGPASLFNSTPGVTPRGQCPTQQHTPVLLSRFRVEASTPGGTQPQGSSSTGGVMRKTLSRTAVTGGSHSITLPPGRTLQVLTGSSPAAAGPPAAGEGSISQPGSPYPPKQKLCRQRSLPADGDGDDLPVWEEQRSTASAILSSELKIPRCTPRCPLPGRDGPRSAVRARTGLSRSSAWAEGELAASLHAPQPPRTANEEYAADPGRCSVPGGTSQAGSVRGSAAGSGSSLPLTQEVLRLRSSCHSRSRSALPHDAHLRSQLAANIVDDMQLDGLVVEPSLFTLGSSGPTSAHGSHASSKSFSGAHGSKSLSGHDMHGRRGVERSSSRTPFSGHSSSLHATASTGLGGGSVTSQAGGAARPPAGLLCSSSSVNSMCLTAVGPAEVRASSNMEAAAASGGVFAPAAAGSGAAACEVPRALAPPQEVVMAGAGEEYAGPSSAPIFSSSQQVPNAAGPGQRLHATARQLSLASAASFDLPKLSSLALNASSGSSQGGGSGTFEQAREQVLAQSGSSQAAAALLQGAGQLQQLDSRGVGHNGCSHNSTGSGGDGLPQPNDLLVALCAEDWAQLPHAHMHHSMDGQPGPAFACDHSYHMGRDPTGAAPAEGAPLVDRPTTAPACVPAEPSCMVDLQAMHDMVGHHTGLGVPTSISDCHPHTNGSF